jgi:hypothetical protein
VLVRALVGAVLGALPGLLLVLVAQFGIEGEMQLTIGVWGIWLAVAGALIGLVIGLRRQGGRRIGG